MHENLPSYWRKTLRIQALLLSIWFFVSYGLGILFVEPLNDYHVGGFPLGFWFSQQGSIYVFIVLLVVYAVWLDRVDASYSRAKSGETEEAPKKDVEGEA